MSTPRPPIELQPVKLPEALVKCFASQLASAQDQPTITKGALGARLFVQTRELEHPRVWEAIMPHYEFFCHACKKTFSKILALVDYEGGEVQCPHCGSQDVEQLWSALSVITSKKSA